MSISDIVTTTIQTLDYAPSLQAWNKRISEIEDEFDQIRELELQEEHEAEMNPKEVQKSMEKASSSISKSLKKPRTKTKTKPKTKTKTETKSVTRTPSYISRQRKGVIPNLVSANAAARLTSTDIESPFLQLLENDPPVPEIARVLRNDQAFEALKECLNFLSWPGEVDKARNILRWRLTYDEGYFRDSTILPFNQVVRTVEFHANPSNENERILLEIPFPEHHEYKEKKNYFTEWSNAIHK